MSQIYKIGIDVGGTHTDSVLVNQAEEIVAKTKQQTTQDIISGIENAIGAVLSQSGVSPAEVKYVMLGTTHCTNAIVERKGLDRVGIIRLCKPAGVAIPPTSDFPDDLTELFGEHIHMVKGGYEFDGRVISALDEDEIRSILRSMEGSIDSLAITGIFSKSNPQQELTVAKWAKEELNNISVTLSHNIGGLGILERENATIINASLQRIAKQMATSFEQAVAKYDIDAQLYFGQNDGTLMSIDHARQYPVRTIACGPTNSIRGAGALTGIQHGIVIDVGGTTTDAGILVNGFPRESSRTNIIGGVKTNFRMPDVLSIGLGGGSIIRTAGRLSIGPNSVGYQLPQRAIAFGGDIMTMTDYAVSIGALDIDEVAPAETVQGQLEQLSNFSFNNLKEKIEYAVGNQLTLLIDKLKTDQTDLPVVLVGGGSIILPDHIDGASVVIKPDHYEVANAYGACIAKVGGEAEQVFNLMTSNREASKKAVTDHATKIAQEAGADIDKIEVITVQETPLAYLPNMTKIKVKVCGDLLF